MKGKKKRKKTEKRDTRRQKGNKEQEMILGDDGDSCR